MTKPDRQSIRIVNLIREQLILAERQQNQWSLIQHSRNLMDQFRSAARKIEICQAKGLIGAGRRMRVQTFYLVRDLRHALGQLSNHLEPKTRTIPTLRELLQELSQIRDEFGGYGFDPKEKTLAVTTEPVELEGIYLGPFEIRFYLDELHKLDSRYTYRVIALEPNPSAVNEVVTHPHVSEERLCEGDASSSILTALQTGRICDFLLMIRSVLEVYNSDSPYVRLDEWEGRPCHECGYTAGTDDCYLCEACEHDFCSECSSYCTACETSLCRSCLIGCSYCDAYHCESCLGTCVECGEYCCSSCSKDGLCPTCRQEQENQDEEEAQEQIDEVKQVEKAATNNVG
jgi:hypothetical protein